MDLILQIKSVQFASSKAGSLRADGALTLPSLNGLQLHSSPESVEKHVGTNGQLQVLLLPLLYNLVEKHSLTSPISASHGNRKVANHSSMSSSEYT
eukprot:CAMPEP_0176008826 /NCGR_PEP_ID=MMETSP0120_2-20121206/3940_1 /TAXON_ID=160619 /ORGANISM="Kryptoperidinium foliaceum, Strain CCMP 1326" /LENGTH=95 /DNA_ID=CAMNT_0017341613 /DNA_START=516 /DNA_END=799 /DNA_ORIENTATION=-